MNIGFVDFYDGKDVLFKKYGFSDTKGIDKNQLIFGRKFIDSNPTDIFSIDTLVGILHLSSKRVYTTGKSGIIKKEFTPFLECFPKILVKTKRTELSPDICAVVKIESVQDNGTICCAVVQYLDDLGNENTDLQMLKLIPTCHWTKKIDKIFLSLVDVDLTPVRTVYDHEIYSIDPNECDDIDDALHCIKLKDGYEIGIHIADVSSYIEEGSLFDIELSKRVETIYYEHKSMKKINMIPSCLSIDVISLKENQKKRSFSVIIKLDEQYNVTNISFEKSIINVTKNLSYDECEKIIQQKSNNTLKMLFDAGKELKCNIQSAFDENDEYDTHQMVAVFMIYANKFVAEKISSYTQTNVLLRSQSGLKITQKISDACCVDENIIKKYNITQSERAIYKLGTTECDHVQMGLKYYTHFTSPIRRYADILVHRQLWSVITNKFIESIPCQTLFRMNSFSKIYKYVQRYSKILDFVHNCEKNEIISEAFITSIFHTRDSIRIHIPDINIDCDVVIINKKLKHLFDIKYDDKIIIKSADKTIEMKLFQKITIKIVITKKNLKKLNVIILDPDIKFLLSSSIADIL